MRVEYFLHTFVPRQDPDPEKFENLILKKKTQDSDPNPCVGVNDLRVENGCRFAPEKNIEKKNPKLRSFFYGHQGYQTLFPDICRYRQTVVYSMTYAKKVFAYL